VVIPVHDEEESLETLHRELDAAVGSRPGGVEILFVDDGSRDASLARMQAIAEKDRRVRVLALDARHGQSAALAAGFRAARGEWIATLDADLQNDPADLPRLLAALDAADVACGVRVARQDAWLRRFSSRVANAFRNRVTGESLRDVGCSLRVMRARQLAGVRPFRGMHRFLPTLLRLEGARVIELPVAHRPRRHGRSKYGVADRLWVGVADCLAVRWMQRRRMDFRVRELRPGDREGPVGP
jgi:glycosyltransferase involved in cell wall biosynthesis